MWHDVLLYISLNAKLFSSDMPIKNCKEQLYCNWTCAGNSAVKLSNCREWTLQSLWLVGIVLAVLCAVCAPMLVWLCYVVLLPFWSLVLNAVLKQHGKSYFWRCYLSPLAPCREWEKHKESLFWGWFAWNITAKWTIVSRYSVFRIMQHSAPRKGLEF